jgi:hypothetical protein
VGKDVVVIRVDWLLAGSGCCWLLADVQLIVNGYPTSPAVCPQCAAAVLWAPVRSCNSFNSLLSLPP